MLFHLLAVTESRPEINLDNKQYHIVVSGTVQGVGFRFTAKDLANRHHIKGWVKNLTDGRVELVAQGPKDNLDIFLKDLRGIFDRNISEFQSQENSNCMNLGDFQILF